MIKAKNVKIILRKEERKERKEKKSKRKKRKEINE